MVRGVGAVEDPSLGLELTADNPRSLNFGAMRVGRPLSVVSCSRRARGDSGSADLFARELFPSFALTGAPRLSGTNCGVGVPRDPCKFWRRWVLWISGSSFMWRIFNLAM
jgi:hypothetical protein